MRKLFVVFIALLFGSCASNPYVNTVKDPVKPDEVLELTAEEAVRLLSIDAWRKTGRASSSVPVIVFAPVDTMPVKYLDFNGDRFTVKNLTWNTVSPAECSHAVHQVILGKWTVQEANSFLKRCSNLRLSKVFAAMGSSGSNSSSSVQSSQSTQPVVHKCLIDGFIGWNTGRGKSTPNGYLWIYTCPNKHEFYVKN